MDRASLADSRGGREYSSRAGVLECGHRQIFGSIKVVRYSTIFTGYVKSTPLCSVFPSINLFRQALILQQDTQYSVCDFLIIGGALQAGCSALYSEDLQHGQQIRDLRILNPFTSSL